MTPVFDGDMRFRFEVSDDYHSTVYLPSEDPSPFASPVVAYRRQVVFWRGFKLVSCKLYAPGTGRWLGLGLIREILDRHAQVVPITQEQFEASGWSELRAYRDMALKAEIPLPLMLNTMIDIEDGVDFDDDADI